MGKLSIMGLILIPVYLMLSLAAGLSSNSVLRYLSVALLVVSSVFLIIAHQNNDWIQPPAEGQAEGEITTEEVRGFFRALPTIICVTVGFNVCYGGMDIYPIQACQMDTQTGMPGWLNSFFFITGTVPQFNSVFYNLGNNLAIIIAIPIVEGFVWPTLRKWRGGLPVTRKTKFNIGFFFCLLSIVVGVIIEIIRKNKSNADEFVFCPQSNLGDQGTCFCELPDGTFPEHTTGQACLAQGGKSYLVSNCAPANAPMTAMSAWWTFVPFFLTGIGEIMVNPVIQEFSYDEVSPRLKSLLMGVTMVVMGCMPAVISGAFVGFIPEENLNNGNVNYVFYAFFAFGVLLLMAYWLIALPERQRVQAEASRA
jgi:dipeptide/tripeptide permease